MKKNKFIRNGIKNLKNNTWWDYDFLLHLEYIKIQQMLDGWEHNKPISSGSDEIIRDLKLALSLLDIHKDNPALGVKYNNCNEFEPKDILEKTKVYCKKYVNTKNFKRFLPKLYDSIEDKNNIPEIWKIELYEQKAWVLYNKLREYKMRNWWD